MTVTVRVRCKCGLIMTQDVMKLEKMLEGNLPSVQRFQYKDVGHLYFLDSNTYNSAYTNTYSNSSNTYSTSSNTNRTYPQHLVNQLQLLQLKTKMFLNVTRQDTGPTPVLIEIKGDLIKINVT